MNRLVVSLSVLFLLTPAAQSETGLLQQARNVRAQVDILGKMLEAKKQAQADLGRAIEDRAWFRALQLQGRASILLWGMEIQNWGENSRWLSHMGAPKEEVSQIIEIWEKALEEAGHSRFQREREKLEDEYWRLRR